MYWYFCKGERFKIFVSFAKSFLRDLKLTTIQFCFMSF